VFGSVSSEKLALLQKGVIVDGVEYGSIKAEIEAKQGANTWIKVALTEGKNREIRRVMKFLGLEVSRLIRLSYGPFQLGKLAKGEVKEIPQKVLREQLGEGFDL
jgi:23S rRNA pseudouridine2605 synthase